MDHERFSCIDRVSMQPAPKWAIIRRTFTIPPFLLTFLVFVSGLEPVNAIVSVTTVMLQTLSTRGSNSTEWHLAIVDKSHSLNTRAPKSGFVLEKTYSVDLPLHLFLCPPEFQASFWHSAPQYLACNNQTAYMRSTRSLPFPKTLQLEIVLTVKEKLDHDWEPSRVPYLGKSWPFDQKRNTAHTDRFWTRVGGGYTLCQGNTLHWAAIAVLYRSSVCLHLSRVFFAGSRDLKNSLRPVDNNDISNLVNEYCGLLPLARVHTATAQILIQVEAQHWNSWSSPW